jgi:hypothetical protein
MIIQQMNTHHKPLASRLFTIPHVIIISAANVGANPLLVLGKSVITAKNQRVKSAINAANLTVAVNVKAVKDTVNRNVKLIASTNAKRNPANVINERKSLETTVVNALSLKYVLANSILQSCIEPYNYNVYNYITTRCSLYAVTRSFY